MNPNQKSVYIRIVEFISSGSLLVMFLVVMIGVFSRYVMTSPLFWTAELSRYLMIYMVFIGSTLSFRNDKQPSLTFLIDKLPATWRSVWDIIIDLFIIAVLAIFVINGWDMVSEKLVGRTPAMRISFRFVYLSIPLGGLSMLIEIVLRLVRRVKKITTLF